MIVKVVTPSGVIFTQDNIESVFLPTKMGEIGIYQGHEPIVTLLDVGEIEITVGNKTESIVVAHGIVEVRDGNEVNILADSADLAKDIDISKAEDAIRKAKDYLEKDIDVEEVDVARLQAMIAKETARLQVGKKYRKMRGINK